MSRVNLTIADDLVAEARRVGINLSAAAAEGIRAELARRDRLAAMDALVSELTAEQGEVDPARQAEVDAWLDRELGGAAHERTA